VTTQFCFRMQATNLTDEPVKLSALKLIADPDKDGTLDEKELRSRAGQALLRLLQ
jgi:hypothetical protein